MVVTGKSKREQVFVYVNRWYLLFELVIQCQNRERYSEYDKNAEGEDNDHVTTLAIIRHKSGQAKVC